MAKGYYYDKRRDHFVVRAPFGKRVHLGSYPTEEEAASVYQKYLETLTVPVSAITTEFIYTDQPSWWKKISAKIRRKKYEREMDKHLEKVNGHEG